MIPRRDLLLAATAMTAAASLPKNEAQAAESAADRLPVRFALNMSTIKTAKLMAINSTAMEWNLSESRKACKEAHFAFI